MESSKPLVVITGISGYLGSQVCRAFLADGTYRIRGTVRDKNNAKKMEPLKKAFGEVGFNQIEFVECDLLKPASLEKAIEGCDFLVHTASPISLKIPKDEMELIRPAVEGTLTALRAAHKNNIKRVVVTSSVAAIMMHTNETSKPLYTEQDWSDEQACEPYEKSKLKAEQAAWEYHSSLPESERFELVTINPGMIIGPAYVQGDFASGDLIKAILLGKMPGNPRIMFPWVDVRNTAFAHVQALKVKEAANKRFILVSKSLWFREVGEILHAEYGQYYSVTTAEAKYCLLKFASIFSKSAQQFADMWNQQLILSNEQSVNILGINYYDPKFSIIDMVESMIQNGLIEDKRPKIQ